MTSGNGAPTNHACKCCGDQPWRDTTTVRKNSLQPWREVAKARLQALAIEICAYCCADADAKGAGPTNIAVANSDDTAKELLECTCESVCTRLHDAWKTLTRTRFSPHVDGRDVEHVWTQLHAAEVELARITPTELLAQRRSAVLADARRSLPTDDPRLAVVQAQLDDKSWNDNNISEPTKRDIFANSLAMVYDGSDNSYRQLRSFRNLLILSCCALIVIGLAVTALGISAPNALPLCFNAPAGAAPGAAPSPAPTTTPTTTSSPSTTTTTAPSTSGGESGAAAPSADKVCPTGSNKSGPSRGDVPLVEFLGLVGGSIAAVVAIRRLRGTSTPYAVPVALAALKLPLGALSAVATMLLIRGGFVPGLSSFDSQNQILAWAIVFGYAQQILTQLVDRQAQDVLTRTTSPAPDKPGDSNPPPNGGDKHGGTDENKDNSKDGEKANGAIESNEPDNVTRKPDEDPGPSNPLHQM